MRCSANLAAGVERPTGADCDRGTCVCIERLHEPLECPGQKAVVVVEEEHVPPRGAGKPDVARLAAFCMILEGNNAYALVAAEQSLGFFG